MHEPPSATARPAVLLSGLWLYEPEAAPPRVLSLETFRHLRLRRESLWLPGGTTISRPQAFGGLRMAQDTRERQEMLYRRGEARKERKGAPPPGAAHFPKRDPRTPRRTAIYVIVAGVSCFLLVTAVKSDSTREPPTPHLRILLSAPAKRCRSLR